MEIPGVRYREPEANPQRCEMYRRENGAIVHAARRVGSAGWLMTLTFPCAFCKGPSKRWDTTKVACLHVQCAKHYVNDKPTDSRPGETNSRLPNVGAV